MTALRNEDIGRFDVAVNDPLGVGGIQALRNLDRQVQDLVGGERLAEDALLQRFPLQELHRNEVLPLVLIDLMDGADIRVVEGRSSLRFPLESFNCMTVLGYCLGEELQGDKAAQGSVLGFVDDTHPSAAQFLNYPIVRNGLTGLGHAASGMARQVRCWVVGSL